MKIYKEESLRNFEFWSGAKDRTEKLTCEQLDEIEQMLEETEPEEGWSETSINDLFWFDFDTIANWLGYESEEMFDFCNKFEEEEREIELGEEVYALELAHTDCSTTISDDKTLEELEVESGMSVEDALTAYEVMLEKATQGLED